ncbi:Pyridine nucleotide-disulfide oxidoreductase domain-containing protein 2 [Nucella lapillus]
MFQQRLANLPLLPLVSRHFHNSGVRSCQKSLKTSYDAIVIGGGHNGLIAAAYLQKSGKKVCVLERRHLLGGAAVTEELVPGFKFSRASYVLSLLRPHIVKDLELKKYGLKVYLRDPSSYTPLIEPGGRDGKARSLLLGRSHEDNVKQIAQFSERDAQAFGAYEGQLDRIVSAITPLLDHPPVSMMRTGQSSLRHLQGLFQSALLLTRTGENKSSWGDDEKVLNQWFESEPLRATLATDSVIGAMTSPMTPGSAYVLLHHVMGEVEGVKGAWGYVEGGMGRVSEAIASCARDHGADIFCDKPVAQVTMKGDKVTGVVLDDGSEVQAKVVLSNATPKITYLDLLPQGVLPAGVSKSLEQFDFTSPVTKINVAVDKIPNFLADPNVRDNEPMPHHRCTIHLNCEDSALIQEAYLSAQMGKLPSKPMIEMVIPSSLDPTVAPPGKHVVLLFTQYTPYTLADGRTWDEETRNQYADTVFNTIEQYAPGFKDSVIDRDILSPPDLERVFGLTGGNIFHGAMSLDQLYMSRPHPLMAGYRCPLPGLYLCGSGAHPGGGVMGSAGRLAAQAVLSDFQRL